MVGTKGFVYIMEVVMISVILMVSLSFLLRPLDVQEDWGPIELRNLGKSALESIYRNESLKRAIFSQEPSLENKLDMVFYNTGQLNVRYNLRVENSYPGSLTVGFNCTGEGCLSEDPEEEYRRLWETLDETWMNNRSIDVELVEVNLNEFSGDGDQADEIDVFFIRGEEQLNKTNQTIDKFKTFMENGGAMVQFTDYLETFDYNIQNEIFGLGDSNTPDDVTGFKNRENSSKPNYEPSKLFYGAGSLVNTGHPGLTRPREGTWKIHGDEYTVEVYSNDEEINVSNRTDDLICQACKEGDSFELGDQNLENDTVSIRKINNTGNGPGGYRNETLVWFDYPRDYRFTSDSFSSSTDSSHGEDFEIVGNNTVQEGSTMIINKPYEGKAVWVSTGSEEKMGKEMQDDIMSLLRAGVIWAGPRGWWLKEAQKSPERRASKVTHFGYFDEDIYEPYKVNMELWYTY